MSSRNGYLSEEEKVKGLNLYKALKLIAKAIKDGEDLHDINDKINGILKNDGSFNYLEIRNAQDLSVPKKLEGELVVLGNYQVGRVRLIDNIEVVI